jgi:hypothetical protein
MIEKKGDRIKAIPHSFEYVMLFTGEQASASQRIVRLFLILLPQRETALVARSLDYQSPHEILLCIHQELL